MPDSLAGLSAPGSVFCDSASGTVFVSGEAGDCTILVDEATHTKVARIPGNCRAFASNPEAGLVYGARFGTEPGYDSVLLAVDAHERAVVDSIVGGWGMVDIAFESGRQRIYTADYLASTVTVVAAGPDTVVARIPVRFWPVRLCLNAARNRLYCACEFYGTVAVIDLEGPALVGTVSVGRQVSGMVLDAAGDRLFVASREQGTITVIDCRGDSILAVRYPDAEPGELAFNTVHDRLYCGHRAGWVSVRDAATDSVLGELPSDSVPLGLAYDATRDQVQYACTASGVVVIADGATNQLVGTGALGTGFTAAAYDGRSRRYYATVPSRRLLAAYDIESGSTLPWLQLAARPVDVVHNWSSNRVYCTLDPPGVSVIDGRANQVLGTFGAPWVLGKPVYSAVQNRIYASGGESTAYVAAIDCADDSVVRTWTVGRPVNAMCLDYLDNRLFIAQDDGGLRVLDCALESLVYRRLFSAPFSHVLHVPAGNKVYALQPWTNLLYVLDAATYGVLATLTVTGWPTQLGYGFGENKVYVGSYEQVYVFDADRDSLVAVIPTPDIDAYYFAYDPVLGRVYVAGGDRYVGVIDEVGDSLVARVRTSGYPTGLACDVSNSRVYVFNNRDEIRVMDGMTNGFVGVVGLPGSVPSDPRFCWNPIQGRTYVVLPSDYCLAVVRDSSPAPIEEMARVECRMTNGPTVVRSVLNLQTTSALLDATGSRVLDLHLGNNDVSRLSPGVYFVCGEGSRARKVVITR